MRVREHLLYTVITAVAFVVVAGARAPRDQPARGAACIAPPRAPVSPLFRARHAPTYHVRQVR